MRWTGHLAYMGEVKNVYKMSVRKPERKRNLTIDGRIILTRILKK